MFKISLIWEIIIILKIVYILMFKISLIWEIIIILKKDNMDFIIK